MRILLFLIIFLSIFSIGLYASVDDEIIEDSLLNNITQQGDVIKKLDAYIDLIQYFRLNDFNKAFEYCEIAKDTAIKYNIADYECYIVFELVRTYLSKGDLESAKKELLAIEEKVASINDNKVTGKLMFVKSIYSSYDNNIVLSMEYGFQSLKSFKLSNDTTGMAMAYNVIGVNYDISDNSQKALDYYLKSVDYAQKVDNKLLLSSLYNNLGVLYDVLQDRNQALFYYNKSLELSYKTNDKVTIVNGLNNIALVHLNDKMYKEALSYFYRALSLAKLHNFSVDEALVCNNMGELYFELNKYDSANYYYQKSISLYSEFQDYNSLAYTTFSVALLNEEMENIETAKSYYYKVLEMLEDNEFDELVEETYEQLSKISYSSKDYSKAYEFLNKAKYISDSIGLVDIDEKLSYAEMQIDFKKQVYEFETEMLEVEKEHLLALSKENKIKKAILLVLVILLIIVLLLYLRSRKSHIVNALLLKRNKAIEEQKALVEISNIELKEQYAFTETLLNTIPNPVFYTNKKGNIIGCNKAFEKIVETPEEELIGTNIKEIHSKTSFQCDLIDKFSTKEDKQDINEGTMVLADGNRHDIICYKQGIVESDDTLIGILGIIIDVTKLKDAERSLKSSQIKLKEAINAKDKFFNIMAHDLKNPFNAVLGLTHLISSKIKNYNQKEIQQYAMLINQSATQIYNLLENLLEWSRAQSGALVKNPVIFDIHDPINECLELLANNFEQKAINIVFNYSHEFKVFVDKNMILTVIRNLLMNAIKYTPENGEIFISTSTSNNIVEVSIADNGIGISEENIDKLFKIDKPISTPGVLNEKGTGLGLIICKEFIDQNDGELFVESNKDKGSTFTFELPAYNM